MALAPLPAAPGVEAGFGRRPLPAGSGNPLGGYGGLFDRRAEGILDPPEARALVLQEGPVRVGLLTLDLVIAHRELRQAVLEEVHDSGFDTLILTATHTHSGPGGYLRGWLPERVTGGEFNPETLGQVRERAVQGLRCGPGDLAQALRVELTAGPTFG